MTQPTPETVERVARAEADPHRLRVTVRAEDLRVILSVMPSLDAQAMRWEPIKTAPYSTVVEVRVGGMTLQASLEPGVSENAAGQSVDQWQAAIEGEHPPCWSEGACWETNMDEVASLQPTAWRAIPLPRRPLPNRSVQQHAESRAKAWATRRAKYGQAGHR